MPNPKQDIDLKKLNEEIEELEERAKSIVSSSNKPDDETKSLLFDLQSKKLKRRDLRTNEIIYVRPAYKLTEKKNEVINNRFARAGMVRNYQKEDLKYKSKFMLQELSNEYVNVIDNLKKNVPSNETLLLENIADFEKILFYLDEYSKMDATAKFYKDEGKKLDLVYNGLTNLSKSLQEQYMQGKDRDANFKTLYTMSENLLMSFDSLRNGELRNIPEKQLHVDTKGMTFKSDRTIDRDISQAEVPLFPHEPSFRDIIQGNIGDCFLVASLSAVAQTNPKLIKECIRDNGDGTATVRFWQRKMNAKGKGQGFDRFEPVYVRVDKAAPLRGSADGSCWVQTIERAYAASGLYISCEQGISSDVIKYNRPAPPKAYLDALYNEYMKVDRSEWPTYEECPWLIDENGDLHKYQPSYKHIVGGKSGAFIEHLLGAGYPSSYVNIASDNEKAEKYSVRRKCAEIMSDTFLDFCKENAAPYTEEEHNNKVEKLANRDVKETYIISEMYKYIMGDKDAQLPMVLNPTTKENEPDTSNDLVYVANVLALDYLSVVNEMELQSLSDKTMKNNFSDFFEKVKSNKNQKLAEHRKEIFESPKLKDIYTKVAERINNKFNEYTEMNRSHEPYDGKYNNRELALKDRIEAAIKYEVPITVGTKANVNGDSFEVDGLTYQHAYAVTGLVKKQFGGKELYFLEVRNPHGEDGRQYKFENGKTVPYACSGTNGEGLIELSDVFKECDVVYLNEYVEEKYSKPEITNPISRETISKYKRALETTLTTLNSAKSLLSVTDSESFVQLKKAVSSTMENISSMEGKDFSTLKNEMKKLEMASTAYSDHCRTKQINNTVRNTRVRANNAIQTICKSAELEMLNPKELFYKDIARSVTFALLKDYYDKKIINSIPSITKRDDVAEKLGNDIRFQKVFENYNVVKLCEKADSPSMELAQSFKETILGVSLDNDNMTKDAVNAPSKAEKEVPEKDADKIGLGAI